MTTDTVQRLGIIEIPLDSIRPNPWQPHSRIDQPAAEIAELAKSILDNGLIQTPVVRFAGGYYEVADGWRRYLACRHLLDKGETRFERITVDQRIYSDQQMANIVIEANQKRKDLNPIEVAETFARYLADFKLTQAEFAQSRKVTQSTVANAIRLLDLPAGVRAMIAAGDLTPAHGIALLQLRHEPCFDADALFLADKAKVSGLTVSLLDLEVKALLTSRRPKMEMPEAPAPIEISAEDKGFIESREAMITETVAKLGVAPSELGATVEELPEAIEEAAEEVKEQFVETVKTVAAKSVHKEPPAAAKPVAKPAAPAPAPAPVLPRPVATAPAAPAVPTSWKRKMIIEEVGDACMVSVMLAGKGPVFKRFEMSLEKVLEMKIADCVLADATALWLPKEANNG